MGDAQDLRVVLADGEDALRKGMRRALEAGGLHVVAEAPDCERVVAAAAAHHPDVCLIATDLPGGGVAASQRIHDRQHDIRIVMLTERDDGDELFECLRAGACGYLAKSVSAERLPFAVRGVAAGEAALPRTLTASLIEEFRERGRRRVLPISVAGSAVELTAREFEVLRRLRAGEQTATIASHLHISEITVRRHISAVMRKLGVTSRRSAVDLLARAERGELAGQGCAANP